MQPRSIIIDIFTSLVSIFTGSMRQSFITDLKLVVPLRVPNEEKRNHTAPYRLHVFMDSREDRNSSSSSPEFLIVPNGGAEQDKRCSPEQNKPSSG